MISSYSVFCSLLSTVFLLLCSGFVEVLLVLAEPLVAAKRRTGHGKRSMLLRFFLYFLLLPPAFSCASFTPLSLSLLAFSFFSLPLCSPISVFFFCPLFSLSVFSFFFFCLTSFLLCFSPRCLVPPLSSLSFISQGKPCGGNGRLVIWRQRDSSHKMCPIRKRRRFKISKWIFSIWSLAVLSIL